MKSIRKAMSEALKEIKPTRKEEAEKKRRISAFLRNLNKNLSDAKAVLGGSAKKNTWLRDSYDIDIFVKFSYKRFRKKSSQLSGLLEKTLRKCFGRIARMHGSRDYFQIIQKGYKYEIVPILDIKRPEDALNITDISPFHAKWVEANLKNPDEARLAKAFAKAQRVYGAESYIKGFSGYCIEILVVYYKGFEGFIRNVAKWKKQKIIDMMKYHRNIMIEVNRSKLLSPLILIDPVQKGRNVAAALSEQNYRRLIDAAKRFLKSPSADFFRRSEITPESLRKKYRRKSIAILRIRPQPGKPDVIGCRLTKCIEYIAAKAEKEGFGIVDTGWGWDRPDEFIAWVITRKRELPEKYERQGPPLEMKEFVREFAAKHRKTFRKKGHIHAVMKRPHTKLDGFIKSLLGRPYLKEKAKGIELL